MSPAHIVQKTVSAFSVDIGSSGDPLREWYPMAKKRSFDATHPKHKCHVMSFAKSVPSDSCSVIDCFRCGFKMSCELSTNHHEGRDIWICGRASERDGKSSSSQCTGGRCGECLGIGLPWIARAHGYGVISITHRCGEKD